MWWRCGKPEVALPLAWQCGKPPICIQLPVRAAVHRSPSRQLPGCTRPAAPAAAWDNTLPKCANVTQGPSCTLNPVGPASYSGNYYTAKYTFYVPDAWEDEDTFFAWRCAGRSCPMHCAMTAAATDHRQCLFHHMQCAGEPDLDVRSAVIVWGVPCARRCFYVCDPASPDTSAEVRADASFTVADPVQRSPPPPPSPPPPSPRPPPPSPVRIHTSGASFEAAGAFVCLARLSTASDQIPTLFVPVCRGRPLRPAPSRPRRRPAPLLSRL